jgi:hypothetical protein
MPSYLRSYPLLLLHYPLNTFEERISRENISMEIIFEGTTSKETAS